MLNAYSYDYKFKDLKGVSSMTQPLKGIGSGRDLFSSIIEGNYYFVDKTPFIKTVFVDDGTQVLLLARPRRFGKTLTLSMFDSFLSINHENPNDLSKHHFLFKDTQILRDQEFCQSFMGQYPVIFLSFKGIEGLNFIDAYYLLLSRISSLFAKFSFLTQSNKISDDLKISLNLLSRENELLALPLEKSMLLIKTSLAKLAQALYLHYEKKVYILIDEYDVPIEKASTTSFYDQMIKLIRSLFDNIFKTNDQIAKIVLTGCLRVSKESIFTGTNNLNVNTVLSDADDFSVGIGFTKEETLAMLDYYGLLEVKDQVQEWYDGYNFSNHHIFCPWDVINFINDSYKKPDKSKVIFRSYWVNTSENNILDHFLGFLSEQDSEDLQTLVDGKVINKKLNETMNHADLAKHRSDDFWSMLLFTGYLTIADHNFDLENSKLNLKIPNKSVRRCFIEKIQNYFAHDTTHQQNMHKILEFLLSGNTKDLQITIENALNKYISVRDQSTNVLKEYYYHGFLNGIFATQEQMIDEYGSNREIGDGYTDLAFVVQKLKIGVIIEIKYANKAKDLALKAKEALTQINEQKYFKFFDNYDLKRSFAYGISFYKKSCHVEVKEF